MVSVERTARPVREAHSATAALLKDTVVKTDTVMQDANPNSVPAMLKPTFLPMASAVRTVRPARAVHMVTAVLLKATVARQTTAMQDVSQSLVLATLKLTSQPMGSAARMERPARVAHMVTAVLLRATVERRLIAMRVAKLPLVPARPTPTRSPPTADAEPSTARLVREAHLATAVPPVTGAVARQNTATPAARVPSAHATAQPAPSPPTVSAVRTARPAREAPTVIAVQPKATVVRQTTAKPVARVPLEPATLALALSLPMEAVARMERLVREAPTVTAVLNTDTAVRVMISAAPDASWPLDFAPVSQPTQSVVPGTARLVLDLVSETVAPQMDSVEAVLLTVVKDGKFTFSMSSDSLLTFFF